MKRRGHRRGSSGRGLHEDGPFTRTVDDIGRNLLACSNLSSHARKNVERLEGNTLVEELLLPYCKRSGKKRDDLPGGELEGAALGKALRKFLARQEPRKPRSPAKPVKKNLANLGRLLGLEPEDLQVLTFVLALDHSERLQELADLFGDVTPSAAARVIAAGMDLSSKTVFRCLAPSGRLVSSGMVRSSGNSYLQYVFDTHTGLLDLVSTPGLTTEEMVARLLSEARRSSLSWSDFEHLQPAADLARDLLRGAVERRRPGLNILLYGPTGTGKSELARRLAQEAGVRAYRAGAADAEGGSPTPAERLSSLLLGQRLLARDRAMLIFDELEDLFSWRWEGMAGDRARGVAHMSKQWFNDMLERCPVPTIWISNATSGMDPAFLRRFTYAVEVGPLDARQRARVLRRHLDEAALDDQTVEALARQHPVSPGQLATAALAAALLEGGGRTDLAASIRQLLEPIQTLLGGQAAPGEADMDLRGYRLDILNADADLTAVADRLSRWQQGASPGVSLCLYGLPGTGKSELVRYLARRAGRPLHRHPASDLLSMWVGGTEKRISAAFRDAEREGAVLLFDEADSFLRDRRGARHSWEVTQVNEFLQQLEVFKGIVACTTNLKEELDMASLRRFVFKIELRPLRPEQARVLLELTLARLGGEAGPARSGELSRLDRMDALTPGDFAAVARRLAALGQDVDAAILIDGLEEELAVKEPAPRSIGFTDRPQRITDRQVMHGRGGNR